MKALISKTFLLWLGAGLAVLFVLGIALMFFGYYIAMGGWRMHRDSAVASIWHYKDVMDRYRLTISKDKTYLVGNDPSDPNSGKLCMLYFTLGPDGRPVQLVGMPDAGADVRAGGDELLPTFNAVGWYIKPDGSRVEFGCAPKMEYWHGLMKYHTDGIAVKPYDKEFARDHFAIVAYPDTTDEDFPTVIINETGAAYMKVFPKPGYIDTWPGPDPLSQGWKRVKK